MVDVSPDERESITGLVTELSQEAGISPVPELRFVGVPVVKGAPVHQVWASAPDAVPTEIQVTAGLRAAVGENAARTAIAHELGHLQHRTPQDVREEKDYAVVQTALIGLWLVTLVAVVLIYVKTDSKLTFYVVSAAAVVVFAALYVRLRALAARWRQRETDADVFAAHLVGRDAEPVVVTSAPDAATAPTTDTRATTFAAHAACRDNGACVVSGQPLLARTY